VLSDNLVEDRLTGLSRLVEGRDHIQTSRRQRLLRSHTRPSLHICALYHAKIPLSNPKGVPIQPTVSLGATSAVVGTNGGGNGTITPTRGAVMDAGIDGRYTPRGTCGTPPAAVGSAQPCPATIFIRPNGGRT
jgi:hypothetical protein